MKHNFYRLKKSGLLMLVLMAMTSIANAGDKYAKVTVSASPTGGGTVYVDSEGQMSASKHGSGSDANVSFTLYASASEGYTFSGWSGNGSSTNNPWTVTVEVNKNKSGEQNANLYNYTATFTPKPKPTFYFQASAVASPAGGGTVTASAVATSVQGAAWNSSSATTTATYSVTGVTEGYIFEGWYDAASGGSRLTLDKVYTKTITSSSTNSGSPTVSTCYAHFRQISKSGTVTLNDLEDHNWTYYKGVDDGYYKTAASNYTGKIYSPDPRNVQITYQANGGCVSITEPETSFVYKETIEKAPEKPQFSGDYAYQVISNPFSVRPRGKGFGGWTVVSGGQYIQEYGDGAVIPIDAVIHFTGLANDNDSDPDSKIVLKANWVDATITRATSNATITIPNPTGATYETNLVVVTCDFNQVLYNPGNAPYTVMMVEPDGSADYRHHLMYADVTPVSGTDKTVKIEYAHWRPNIPSQNTGLIDPRGCNYTIGRGMVIYDQPGETYSLRGSRYGSEVNQTVKVESGKYVNMVWYDHAAGATFHVVKSHIYFGCDYDRAKGDNSKLQLTSPDATSSQIGDAPTFSNIVSGSDRMSEGQYDEAGSNVELCRMYIKSGKIRPEVNTTSPADESDQQIVAASQVLYFGVRSHEPPAGYRYLEIQGGEISHICGGMCTNQLPETPSFTLRMKGGKVRGCIFGAAQWSPAAGIRRMVFTGGEINGWIAAGANGTRTDGGLLDGNAYLYIGGKTQVKHAGNDPYFGKGYAQGGNVFGAGCGNSESDPETATAGKVNNSNVVIADNAYVERNVYGGGNYGFVADGGTSRIYVTGGTVGGNVFGGSNNQKGQTVNIFMTGGTVSGGLYGGSNTQGTIQNSITMTIQGGKVATVHGGGYGPATKVNGNIDLAISDGQVTGDVYGGSAKGTVNTNTSNHTNVTLSGGTVGGNLYGGGLGDSENAAHVLGKVKVQMTGGSVKNVFGGNNTNGYPREDIIVTVSGGTVSQNIYGGGNQAAATANTHVSINNLVSPECSVFGGGNLANLSGNAEVTVEGCSTKLNSVYGGGNAAHIVGSKNATVTINGGTITNVFGGGNGQVSQANITGNATINIHGGKLSHVYAGSNTNGVISGTATVNVDHTSSCEEQIGELYGGGNQAAGNAGTINIGCGAIIGDVFGGANQANVTSSITLNITGGTITNVFGGNNTSGSISGKITVNVEKGSCDLNLTNVYGGGKNAPYTAPSPFLYPEVNIKKGVVKNNVYGGGYGSGAVVTGNPRVTVSGGEVQGSVYGGGESAAVTGSTLVNLSGGTVDAAYGGGNNAAISANAVVGLTGSVANNIYGGGNNAGIGGNVAIGMVSGQVKKGLYGGSNANGTIGGNVTIGIGGGKVGVSASSAANIHGGGYGQNTKVSGNVDVVLGQMTVGSYSASGTEEVFGDVYGGSALGTVNTSASNHTNVTLNKGVVHGALYGGALGNATVAANVNGAVQVKVEDGSVDKVYGCNNLNGAPQSTVHVDIYKGTVGSVFGGGNQASYAGGTPIVVVHDCEAVLSSVYGGGDAAHISNGNTDVTIYGGTITDVFGGGNGQVQAANVSGSTNVKIYGGTITNVYGGSNTSGTIGGGQNVTANKNNTQNCDLVITNLYSGGNKAASGPGSFNIGCVDRIYNLYGGANQADINGDITLNIVSGKITNVFGGNNNSGSISGKITVNVCDNGAGCFDITNVYGGGNKAAYTYSGNAPVVNVVNATLKGNVFGGGLGASATVSGNPQVTIGDKVAAHRVAILNGDVYGGGDEAPVLGTTTVTVVDDCNTQLRNLYGGGNAAAVGGTHVVYRGGSVTSVFGGGHGDRSQGKEAKVNGNVQVDLLGGVVKNAVFGGSDSKGNITQQVTLNVKESTSCPLDIKNVYGGGNQAEYAPTNASLASPAVNIIKATIKENVFGGGLGTTALSVSHPTVHVGGTASGETVNVNVSVYGGGSAAPVEGSTSVTVDGNKESVTVHSHVFGGGLGATAKIKKHNGSQGNTDVKIIGEKALLEANVYGGGNAGDVEGNTYVQIGE